MGQGGQFGQLECLDIRYHRALEVEITEEVVVLELSQLHKGLLEVTDSKMRQLLHELQMLKNILIQPPTIFDMNLLQILAALTNHPQILIPKITIYIHTYSLSVIVNLTNSPHRLKHTKLLIKEHRTSSTTLSDLKEELTICSK